MLNEAKKGVLPFVENVIPVLIKSFSAYFLGNEMRLREYRDSGNRLTVALENMPSLAYRFVRWKLCRHFRLKKSSEYVKNLEEKFQVFCNSEGKVSIDWDVWSGFSVTALNNESEGLVRKIGDWLNKKYGAKG